MWQNYLSSQCRQEGHNRNKDRDWVLEMSERRIIEGNNGQCWLAEIKNLEVAKNGNG
ncbi:hypothetical protein ES703_109756 [subsurface metagenome]